MRNGHLAFLLSAFVLLISNSAFADLLVSQPDLGGQLHILLENGGNTSASVTTPGGISFDVALVDGQASIAANESGRWKISAGGMQKISIVGSDEAPMLSNQEPQSALGIPAMLLGACLLFIFASLLAGMWYFFVRTPKKSPSPSLTKVQIGGNMALEFSNGSDVAENLRVRDSVGKGWEGKPMLLQRKRLAPYETASVKYEFEGEPSLAFAEFEQNGKKITLQSNGADLADDSPAAPGKPVAKRKLKKA